METLISVIGGANVDLLATLADTFIAADSNPGHIDVGYGGVARNIAHNLSLLGARTQLLTVFGGDLFGGLLHDYCKQQGIDVHLSERESALRSGLYVCINNKGGEMIAAVADTEAIRAITPEWLAKRSGEINMSDYIVADTNLTEDSIRWLMENVTAPLFIDGVSSTKAHRVVNALSNIVNTTGAGDAFLAGVVYAHTKGIDFPQTAQYGLMAARATLMSPRAVNPDIANILL